MVDIDNLGSGPTLMLKLVELSLPLLHGLQGNEPVGVANVLQSVQDKLKRGTDEGGSYDRISYFTGRLQIFLLSKGWARNEG